MAPWIEHVTDGPVLRRLLLELAGVLPDEVPGQVTGLSVRHGWGGIVSVRVHTSVRPTPEWELGAAIRVAVRRALGVQRHELSFVWDGASAATHPAT
jgi:hypothetical protein